MKTIRLLDDTLEVAVGFSCEDADLEDNICIVVNESCPEDEKIFKHEESHIFLTRRQAQELADALSAAVQESESNIT